MMKRLVTAALVVLVFLVAGLVMLKTDDEPSRPRPPREAGESSQPVRTHVDSRAPDPNGAAAEAPADPTPPAAPRPDDVGVQVVGPAGRPAADARVVAVAWNGDIVAERTPDAAGKTTLPRSSGSPASSIAWMRATGPGDLVSHWTRFEPRHRPSPRLELLPGTHVAGVVIDARSGAPIAGARVELRESQSQHVAASAPPLVATTDTDGRFGPVLVARGRHVRIAAARDGYSAATAGRDVPADGPLAPLRLELEAAGSITVTVLAPDGTAAAGARVVVVGADSAYMDIEALLIATPGARAEAMGHFEATTDASGRAIVNRLAADGAFVVLATAEGSAPSTRSRQVQLDEEHTGEAVTVTLRAFGRISARVVGPDEQPITTAVVRLAPRYRWGGSQAATLEDGAYVMEGLTPGAATLIVEAEDHPTAVLALDVPSGETVEPTVELVAPVTIAGVVLDDRGLPVAGATVSAFPVNGSGWAPSVRYPDVNSDPSGAFVVAGLAPGTYTLSAFAANHRGESLSDPPQFSAPSEGATLRIVRQATVRLRLVLPDGVAAPRTVAYSGGGGSGVWNFRDGRVSLSGVNDGDHTLCMHADGFAAFAVEFHAVPGDELDLGEVVLDPGVPIRGRVLLPSGEPVGGATVQLDRSDSLGDPKTTTDAAGRFEIPHAARDSNRLRVSREGHVTVRPTLHGDPSAEDAEIELPRGAVLRIRVRGPETAAYGRALVIRDGDGSKVATPHTDERGLAEIRLAAGSYDVAPFGSTIPTAHITLIEAGPDVEVDLQLE